MKLLILSLDRQLINPNSRSAQRVKEYGKLAEINFLVPGKKDEFAELTPAVKVFAVGGKNKFCSFIKMHQKAKELLKDKKHDLISVQDQYFLGFLGCLLAKKFNLALEIQVHGFEKFAGIRKIIARRVLTRADRIRTVSRRLKNILVEDFNISEEKIAVIPIFCAEIDDKTNNDLKTKKSSTGRFIFLTIGRLVPVKNISLQIQAMAKVVKNFPQAELWVVGDGPEWVKLANEVNRLKLEKNIKFWGWQKNVSDFYEKANVFLLTSDSEGWPLVILEAARAGVPIIMTNVGSAGELIINEKNGLVIPVKSKVDLEIAMERLINDPALRNGLGKKAREGVLSLPTKEEIFKLYQNNWKEAAVSRFGTQG